LKWSNGSWQARQTHKDLHAVEPNLLSSTVSGDPHCGQRMLSVSAILRPDPETARGSGGAIP
jgi:hypothetical protein